MTTCSQLADDSLSLSEGIGADEDASTRFRVEPVKKSIDFCSGCGVAKDRQSERGLGYENVARNGHKWRAGRVWTPLVVAGNDDFLALVLEHDLGGTENMPCRYEAYLHVADADRFTIVDSLPARLGSIPAIDDGKCFLGCENCRVIAAGVVAVPMSDHCSMLWFGRINPCIGRTHVNSFRVRFDPGTQSRHCELYRQ